MKDMVFDRRAGFVVSVISLTMLWAALVVPGGPTWPVIAGTGALVALLVGAAVVLIGMARSPLMGEVIDGVEAEARATAPGRMRSLDRGPR
jgi:hypothetical protein